MGQHRIIPRTFPWRAFFLVGVACVTLLSAFVLGGRFSGLVAAVSAAVAVVNAVAAPPRDADSSDGWVAWKAKHLLSTTTFLKIATGAAWCAVLLLLGVAYAHSRGTPLRGHVVTPTGEPAAEILLSSAQDPKIRTVSDATGDFSLPIRGAHPGDTVVVNASWEGRDTSFSVVVTRGGSVVRLSAAIPPLRVQYSSVSNVELEDFREGIIGQRWAGNLELTKRHPIPLTPAYRWLLSLPSALFSAELDMTPAERDSLFRAAFSEPGWVVVGGYLDSPARDFGGFELLSQPSPPQVLQLLARQREKIALSADLLPADKRAHLAALDTTILFYRNVGRLIPGFYLLAVLYDECAGMSVELQPRLLAVRVVVFDNPDRQKLYLGDFRTRHHTAVQPRPSARDRSELQRASPALERLYPTGWLVEKEALIVPLSVEFVPNAVFQDKLGESGARRRDLVASLASLAPGDTIRALFEGDTVPLTAAALRAALLRGAFPYSGDYVVGPSLAIDQITMGERRYPLHPPDNYAAVRRGPWMGASCPLVYTRDAAAGNWLSRGAIARERRYKSREGTSELRFAHAPALVVIAEEEPETTLLDRVYIRGHTAGGKAVVVVPRIAELRAADHRYFALGQGRKLVISLPARLFSGPVYLGVTGYFVPVR